MKPNKIVRKFLLEQIKNNNRWTYYNGEYILNCIYEYRISGITCIIGYSVTYYFKYKLNIIELYYLYKLKKRMNIALNKRLINTLPKEYMRKIKLKNIL